MGEIFIEIILRSSTQNCLANSLALCLVDTKFLSKLILLNPIFYFNLLDFVIICVLGLDHGEVYTWGWKECVPRGKLISDRTDWVNDVFGGPYNCSTSENVLLKKHIVNLGGQGDHMKMLNH